MFDIFPLRSDADYKRALSIIENTPPGDAKTEADLEILAQLVKLWEKEHHEFNLDVAPHDLLRELMILKRTSPTQIAEILDTPASNVSAIMTGRRKLNTAQAEKLAEYFGIKAVAFGKLKAPRFSLPPDKKGLRQRA